MELIKYYLNELKEYKQCIEYEFLYNEDEIINNKTISNTERISILKYLRSEKEKLNKKINFLVGSFKDIQKEIIKIPNTIEEFKENYHIKVNPKFNKEENYFGIQPKYICSFLPQDMKKIYLELETKIKKELEESNILLKKINKDISLYSVSVYKGFYKIKSLKQWTLISSKEINYFNSILIADNKADILYSQALNNNLFRKNINLATKTIPELCNDLSIPEKTYIVVNGYGLRKGGLFNEEIIARTPAEALFKINEKAKQNNSINWSSFHLSKSSSSGLIGIFLK